MILTVDTHPPKASCKDEACSGEQLPPSSMCFLQDAEKHQQLRLGS